MLALKLTQAALAVLAKRYTQIYHSIARMLSHRLLQRNATIGAYREKVRVFIISSVEALPIARNIESAFEHDPFTVHLWTAGCFKVASYTIDDLEEAVDKSDFAVASRRGG